MLRYHLLATVYISVMLSNCACQSRGSTPQHAKSSITENNRPARGSPSRNKGKNSGTELRSQRINNFQALTLDLPSLGDSEYVRYLACPVARASWPGKLDARDRQMLTDCLSGESFGEKLMLPFFAPQVHLKLDFCDARACQRSESRILDNPNALSFDRMANPAHELGKVRALIVSSEKHSELRSALAKLVASFAQGDPTNCTATLDPEVQGFISGLRQMNYGELYDYFTASSPDELLDLLAKADVSELLQEDAPDLIGLGYVIKDRGWRQVIEKAGLFFVSIWGFYGSIKGFFTLHTWYKRLRQRRRVNIGERKVVQLVQHKWTGFLVPEKDRDQELKNMPDDYKFYVEDPQRMAPISRGEKYSWVSLTKEYVTGNSKDSGSAKTGIKYASGRFYEYDYDSLQYKVLDAQGKELSKPTRTERFFANFSSDRLAQRVLVRRPFAKDSEDAIGGLGEVLVNKEGKVELISSGDLKGYYSREFDLKVEGLSDFRRRIAIKDVEYYLRPTQDFRARTDRPLEFAKASFSIVKLVLSTAALVRLAQHSSLFLADSDCSAWLANIRSIIRSIVSKRVAALLADSKYLQLETGIGH